jgi:hypothetical protein
MSPMGHHSHIDTRVRPRDGDGVWICGCATDRGMDIPRVLRLVTLYLYPDCEMRATADDVYQCWYSYSQYSRQYHIHSDV